MSYEERLFTERVNAVMSQWPMVDEAWGCENCRLLFRDPVIANMRCPQCDSESIFVVNLSEVK